MSDQFVFELQFIRRDGSDFKENQFVIIDGGSMANLSKLREDLNKCIPEPFAVQYMDDEGDTIAIDSEEEFKEFAKLVKQRAIRGMLMRLILISSPSKETIGLEKPSDPFEEAAGPTTFFDKEANRKKIEAREKHLLDVAWSRQEAYRKMKENIVLEMDPADVGGWEETKINKLKKELKDELREEILLELKGKMEPSNQAHAVAREEVEYTEDSDGNQIYLPEKRKFKFATKKLGRKEKFQSDLEQRIEKLELKKKKLLEKVSLKSNAFTKAALNRAGDLPFLMSGTVTEDCIRLGKVTVGKTFWHLWNVVNDGTVDWKGVVLRHYWSSPGLEIDETVLKCPELNAGQVGHLYVKFKAPQTETSFSSYWHFYCQVGAHWQQFGHYVSVTGVTRPPKPSNNPNDISIVYTLPDGMKKSKQGAKNVTFSEVVEPIVVTPSKATKEARAMNEESKFTYMMRVEADQQQLEAKLASAQIAAEMAREAANATIRRAMSIQDKNKVVEEGTNVVDEAVKEKQVPVQSANDTDPIIDINEETDPGFVLVNFPSAGTSSTLQGFKMTLREGNLVDSTTENELNEAHPESNVEDKTVTSSNEQKESNEINSNDILINSDFGAKENAENPKQPCIEISFDIDGDRSYGKPVSHQPLSFPKLNPTVHYPVFPPPPRVAMGVYPSPLPHMPHQHNPHGYPVFPPQNSSSHAFVLPPPPFNPPKLNTTTMHYSHPNFQSHQIPLLSSCLPPPSGIPPHSHIPQPQIPNLMPTPGYVVEHPVRVFGVENIAPQMNPAFPGCRMSESETNTSANSTCVPLSYANSGVTQTEASSATPPATAQEPFPRVDGIQNQNDKAKNAEPTGVQILPQALVDGAINVAATAYSTAWNALNNLRPKEGEATEFDPVFENNLALLSEMGFNNLERNARLLKRFNNDIAKVIGVICATSGNNLEID